MADRTGEQLGNYRLIRLLGRGGFAEVYLGEHVRLQTQVAVKVLHAQLASDEVEAFQKEAYTIARLNHPNIIRIFDYDVHEGVPYLVMDYAPQGTLRQRHPRAVQLPPAAILPYVKQTADALQYAHDEKFIHRDVKPENMLLDRRGAVLLSDFGIAIVVHSSRYQSTQDVIGTVAYMAPEQIQAHARPASDQYSLGVVIYEWLSGERPFQGAMSEVIAKQLFIPPAPLREKVAGLSPAVEEVALTALAKDPQQRFASMRAFAAAFENACRGESAIFFLPTQMGAPFPRETRPLDLRSPSGPSGVGFGSSPFPPAAAINVAPTIRGSSGPAADAGDFPSTIPGVFPAWSEDEEQATEAAFIRQSGSGAYDAPTPPPGSGPQFVRVAGPVGGAVGVNPPASGPVSPPLLPRSHRGLKIGLTILLILLLLGGGGAAAYVLIARGHLGPFAPPPQPMITVISTYQGGDFVGGPPDTVLHVSGQDFSSNSTITFLLDGAPAPGSNFARSDANGNFTTDLTITDAWTFTTHRLTARDASGYMTRNTVSIRVIPQPVMTVTSNYHLGANLAGANGTKFTISGKRFSPNATITFLLDNQATNGNRLQSDSKGQAQGSLAVTNWALGDHMLSAKDSQGYTTQENVPITIVAQGIAGTPGPNGAPADDASFSIHVSLGFNLTITGRPDPDGGTVCNPSADSGQPHTYTGTLTGSGRGYTETISYSCSGSYKSGHLTYTQTDTSDQFVLSDGTVCNLQSPYASEQVDGMFTSSTGSSGTYQTGYFYAPCSDGSYVFRNPTQGNWSGYIR